MSFNPLNLIFKTKNFFLYFLIVVQIKNFNNGTKIDKKILIPLELHQVPLFML